MDTCIVLVALERGEGLSLSLLSYTVSRWIAWLLWSGTRPGLQQEQSTFIPQPRTQQHEDEEGDEASYENEFFLWFAVFSLISAERSHFLVVLLLLSLAFVFWWIPLSSPRHGSCAAICRCILCNCASCEYRPQRSWRYSTPELRDS